jgi:hypothetical protein
MDQSRIDEIKEILRQNEVEPNYSLGWPFCGSAWSGHQLEPGRYIEVMSDRESVEMRITTIGHQKYNRPNIVSTA